MKQFSRAVLALFFCLNFLSARAATLLVTRTADHGAGTLRDTLAAAQSGDTIHFSPDLAGQTISLTNGELVVNGLTDLTIDASTLPEGMTINGYSTSRIFDITNRAVVTLNGLTIANGYVNSSDAYNNYAAAYGGGIRNNNDCTLTVIHCAIYNNYGSFGGGIYNGSGTLVVTASTLNYNSVAAYGGGIYNESGTVIVNNSTLSANALFYGTGGGIYNNTNGTIQLNQSTVSGNAGYFGTGGGVYNAGGLTLFDSIVAGNFSISGDPNIHGTYTNLGVNVVDVPVALAPLGNYGGPTLTMPPLATATNVIDQGDDAAIQTPYNFTTDQRGLPRLAGAHVDIGAVEWQTNEPRRLMVTVNADNGPGSLRDTLSQATDNTVILFDLSLTWETILLTNGELVVNGLTNLTIDASGLANNVVIDGNHTSRIFEFTNNSMVTLNGLTIVNGSVAGAGGGAMNNSGCALAVTNCFINGNYAETGGGIANDGELVVSGSVLSNNLAIYYGGGIENGAGTVAVNQSTLAGNQTFYNGSYGGGIYNDSGIVTVNQSALAGNAAYSWGGGIYNNGTLTLDQDTLSGNAVLFYGGGGGIYNAGSLAVNQDTLSGNFALYNSTGGGIYNDGQLTLFNSIVAGNTMSGDADSGQANIYGAYLDQGTNVVDQPVALAPLGNYGGPTMTMPPEATATNIIDQGDAAAINPPYNFTTDQRGYPRLVGAQVDIGAVERQGVTVTTTTDSGFGSLRAVLAQAVNGDTIDFAPDLAGQTIGLTSGALAVTGLTNLTIDASALPGGVVINANYTWCIFVTSQGVVTLNGLTMLNGFNSSGGGIVNESDCTLNLNHCTLRDNYANNGGGIYNGGTLVINESILSGNYNAYGYGAGICNAGILTVNASTFSGNYTYSSGGGIYNSGTTTVNASTLSGNFATSDNGGGIYNDGTLTVNSSTLFGNFTGYGNGGGIYNNGTLSMAQATVSGNSAHFGGGIYTSYSGAMTLFNSIVSGNAVVYGDTNISNGGSYVGQGVNVVDEPVDLAPLRYYGGPTMTMPPLPTAANIIDQGDDEATNGSYGFTTDQRGVSRLAGAHVDIGAVEQQAEEPLLGWVMTDVNGETGSLRDVLAHHISSGGIILFDPAFAGQRIYLGDRELLVDGLTNLVIDASALPRGLMLSGNNTSRIFELTNQATMTLNGLTLINGYAADEGGGIWNGSGCALTITNCTIRNSYSQRGAAIGNAGELTLAASTLTGNLAYDLGGGIYNDSGTVTLNQATLNANVAVNLGGGIYNNTGTLIVNASTLSGNSVTHGSGGGIYGNGSLTLFNSIVAGNAAAVSPTNLYGDYTSRGANVVDQPVALAPLGNYGGPTMTMPPEATATNIIDQGDIAALYAPYNFTNDQRGLPRVGGTNIDIGAAERQSTTVTVGTDGSPGSLRSILGLAVNGDTIDFDAGLLGQMYGQIIQLTQGELLVNGLTNLTINASALPGGVVIDGSHASRIFELTNGAMVTLNGLTMTNGFVTGAGGGGLLNNYGCTLTVTNCQINGNSADFGGGIGNYSVLVVNGSTLTGNSAIDFGGGIDNEFGRVTVNQSTLSGNSVFLAGGFGGGIFNLSTLVVNQSTLNDNYAYGWGGGIYNKGQLTLNQDTLSGNAVLFNGGGGGIYNNYYGDVAVNACTISGNSAGYNCTGGGIDLETGTLTLFNSIVAGNEAAYGLANIDGVYTSQGVNVVDEPVRLAPLRNYGGPTMTMPPEATAANIIDQGDDAAVSTPYNFTTDQRGFARPSGAHVDIGAAERQPAIVTVKTDGGTGSLRELLSQTVDGDTITFVAGLNGQTILLTNGELAVSRLLDLTIDASALPSGVVIDANHASRIFNITDNTRVTLNRLNLINGTVAPSVQNGGAILVDSGSALTVEHCTISTNSAYTGGGIANYGTLTVNASTLNDNSAINGLGGGIGNYGALTVNQSLLIGNSATGSGGGGIYTAWGPTVVNRSTLSSNVATSGSGGGIVNSSPTLLLNQDTFTGNYASNSGGGIVSGNGTLIVNQCTLTGNSARAGGGIEDFYALTLFNSIVAGNLPSNVVTAFDLYTNLGVNLVDQPVALLPLGYYGGPTPTMPPLATATNIIDQGSDTALNAPYNFTTDQRGYARRSGAHVDIGAVELQLASQPPALVGLPLAAGGGGNSGNNGGGFQLGFTNASGMDFTVYGSTNLNAPLSQWQNLGRAVETPVGSGQYQFSDPQTAIKPQSFYRVTSP
ncbi:MAG TPA: choice-of-anchor Q domain-containing protein [Verrucomicrobiae bacterium]|jgi:hypothetical protein